MEVHMGGGGGGMAAHPPLEPDGLGRDGGDLHQRMVIPDRCFPLQPRGPGDCLDVIRGCGEGGGEGG